MIKLLGIILISSGIFLYGKSKSHEQILARNITLELLELLHSLQRELTYGNHSKQEVFRRFSGKALEQCGFLDAVISGTNTEDAINKHLTLLDKNEKQLLTSFLSDFGKCTSRQNEANKCNRFIEEFEESIKLSTRQRNNKAILYSKLSIILSIMTAVILI